MQDNNLQYILYNIPQTSGVPITFDIIEKLEVFGKTINRNILELSLAWVAQQKQVGSVLVGATSPEQIKQNIHAISWEMTESELEEVNKIVLGN